MKNRGKGTHRSRAPKSPKMRAAMKREAEANERKCRPSEKLLFDNPAEAVKQFKPR